MAACAKRNVLTANQKKLIKLHDKKVKQTEIAKLYGVNRSIVHCIIRRYERRGDIENLPRSGRRKLVNDRAQRA